MNLARHALRWLFLPPPPPSLPERAGKLAWRTYQEAGDVAAFVNEIVPDPTPRKETP